jgi:hypothetical protein
MPDFLKPWTIQLTPDLKEVVHPENLKITFEETGDLARYQTLKPFLDEWVERVRREHKGEV